MPIEPDSREAIFTRRTGVVAIPLLPASHAQHQKLVEPLPADSVVGMGAGMQQSSAQRRRR